MGGTSSSVHFHDIPDVVLATIFSLVTDTRTRNAMSLVCPKWYLLERSTRKSLTLRGNVRDLFLLRLAFELSLILTSLCYLHGDTLFLIPPQTHSFSLNSFVMHFHRLFSHSHTLAPTFADATSRDRVYHTFRALSFAFLTRCFAFSLLDRGSSTAIEAYPTLAASLSHLNILKHSSAEGFKSHELLAITASCPNLRELLATCMFDHRFVGFVGDQTLLALAANCPSFYASITHAILGDVFARLPLLEVLVLDVCHNVGDAWPALELLNSRCPRLKSLKLGQFHGICRGIDSRPDGIALCQGLESLLIKNSADLTDNSLEAISLGCPRLSKFEVQGCKKITVKGIGNSLMFSGKLWSMSKFFLQKPQCSFIIAGNRTDSGPDRATPLDCVWDSVDNSGNHTGSSREETRLKKKSKSLHVGSRTWSKLHHLSLWIAVGELLTPLSMAGLDDCPSLEEIEIKIEGDCRDPRRPCNNSLGLRFLSGYPSLSRCFWTAVELSAMVSRLHRAHDMDVNQRSLFLPAAALLSQCGSLRKLFIHGTANEHFMMFLLRIPTLRDVQLREDYYPAPENDTTTEMRVGSCRRFEDALNSINRHGPD
ncbi:Detected protein of unknown function [Hibiscus syriacus]|uniref:COI1 F-box domain-containing protein n=1 Tax=Hibiscus syriacus TaxID=106335 RepID=A0A6A2ZBU8_HIBSY|nr:Detected protein of unknown function [Hibiscus syriacus]